MSLYKPQNINGILLLDKPLYLSSNEALQKVKRLFCAKKAGHTGSLDPLATGMLPICFGDATKFSQFLLESDKVYDLAIRLGVKTTTGDGEGEVIAERSTLDVTREAFENVLLNFKGPIQQTPPMFSAIKYRGKPLYALARKGIEVPRASRLIHIYKLNIKSFSKNEVHLSVHCSKGTYIRTLACDIGDQLGCGAYISQLRRTAVSPYLVHPMYSLEALLEQCTQSGVLSMMQLLLPVESAVERLPGVNLSSSAIFYMRMGQSILSPHQKISGLVRILTDKNHFIGVGEVQENGRLIPKRMLKVPEQTLQAIN